MSKKRRPTPQRRCAGTALVLMIILSAVITGLVMTLAWTVGIHTQIANQTIKLDKTYAVAEAAANKIVWYVKHGTIGTITSPQTGTLNGCNYSTSWTNSSGTYTITGTATNGTVSQSVTMTCAPTTTYAVLSVGGSGGTLDVKDMTINGSVLTNGAVTSTSGTTTVNGNLTYGTTISNSHMTVTGATTNATTTVTGPDYATIQAAATLTLTGNQSNHTFDFTSNSTIYVNGNVTDPSFVGSGTLLVSGTVTFSSASSYGSATNPVNLVSESNVTLQGTFDIYGSLYAGGNITAPTKMDYLSGPFYCGGSVSGTLFHGTIDPGTKPWFDTRSASGATVAITKFSDPTP
jgi:hypothetical protein